MNAAKREISALLDLYPTERDMDRGVLAAYIFSHAARSAYPLCPAFGFDAGEINSGKTYAAVSLGRLMGANVSLLTPPTEGDAGRDEIGKSVAAVMLADEADTIIVDEVPGSVVPNIAETSNRY